jgi:hypothetical protein
LDQREINQYLVDIIQRLSTLEAINSSQNEKLQGLQLGGDSINTKCLEVQQRYQAELDGLDLRVTNIESAVRIFKWAAMLIATAFGGIVTVWQWILA